MNVDAAGVVHEGNKALSRLYEVANAPLFTITIVLRRWIVGGPMNFGVEPKRKTVAVTMRILGGEKAGNINIPAIGIATPKFDWRQMQRWGISESSLPPGSQIYFREPGLWDQYRLPILVIIAAILAASRPDLLADPSTPAAVAGGSPLAQRHGELANMNRLATAGQYRHRLHTKSTSRSPELC